MSHPDQAFGDKTYAQYGEDLILLNIFQQLGIEKGKYFDVGAHHPFNISNTALLYERGWRGVCVEANSNHIPAFLEHRPEDTILNLGVATITGEMTLYMVDDYSGRNSFDREVLERFVDEHPTFAIRGEKKIPVVTLGSLFEKFGTPDLLSIDIEGLDYEVLQHTLPRYRPRVICVESDKGPHSLTDLLYGFEYDRVFTTLGNGIYLNANSTGYRN